MRCRRSGQIWTVTILQGKEKTQVMLSRIDSSLFSGSVSFFRLNLKVEERALLVINCAGNEGDTVEKIAGNIPKVMRTIELNWLISSILSHAFIHRIFDHHLELSNFFYHPMSSQFFLQVYDIKKQDLSRYIPPV